MLSKIWAFLHSKDLYTWIGHGIMGFLLTWFISVEFTLGAFVYREVSDLLGWWAQPGLAGIDKPAFGAKAKDGFFDLWAPLAGAAVALILQAL